MLLLLYQLLLALGGGITFDYPFQMFDAPVEAYSVGWTVSSLATVADSHVYGFKLKHFSLVTFILTLWLKVAIVDSWTRTGSDNHGSAWIGIRVTDYALSF